MYSINSFTRKPPSAHTRISFEFNVGERRRNSVVVMKVPFSLKKDGFHFAIQLCVLEYRYSINQLQ